MWRREFRRRSLHGATLQPELAPYFCLHYALACSVRYGSHVLMTGLPAHFPSGASSIYNALGGKGSQELPDMSEAPMQDTSTISERSWSETTLTRLKEHCGPFLSALL